MYKELRLLLLPLLFFTVSMHAMFSAIGRYSNRVNSYYKNLRTLRLRSFSSTQRVNWKNWLVGMFSGQPSKKVVNNEVINTPHASIEESKLRKRKEEYEQYTSGLAELVRDINKSKININLSEKFFFLDLHRQKLNQSEIQEIVSIINSNLDEKFIYEVKRVYLDGIQELSFLDIIISLFMPLLTSNTNLIVKNKSNNADNISDFSLNYYTNLYQKNNKEIIEFLKKFLHIKQYSNENINEEKTIHRIILRLSSSLYKMFFDQWIHEYVVSSENLDLIHLKERDLGIVVAPHIRETLFQILDCICDRILAHTMKELFNEIIMHEGFDKRAKLSELGDIILCKRIEYLFEKYGKEKLVLESLETLRLDNNPEKWQIAKATSKFLNATKDVIPSTNIIKASAILNYIADEKIKKEELEEAILPIKDAEL